MVVFLEDDGVVMKITLSLPPSSNTAYPTDWKNHRRFLSEAGQAWIRETLWELKSINETFDYCKITLTFYFPDRRKRDIYSYHKLPVDCLVKTGIISDDNYMVNPEAILVGRYDKYKPRLVMEVEALTDPEAKTRN